MKLEEHFKKIFLGEDPFTKILGQDNVKSQLKSALLVNRHVLLIGAPGIGKTTLAKNIARILPEMEVNDCPYHCMPNKPICPKCKQNESIRKRLVSGEERFIRIQGSPDLTAEDLIGDIDPVKAMKFGPLSLEAFTPGKIFKANNGILFFDELNRCPEKLQNALLQVLSEGAATIGSYDVDIEANFIFIGTMNPKDASTERLSDVLLDRFDIIYCGYPETDALEKEIVEKEGISMLPFASGVLDTMIGYVRDIRENKNLEKVPSVRASIGLYERAQANAFLKRRLEVEFEDVEKAMISVLSHRIKLKPAAEYLQSPSEFIEESYKDFRAKHQANEKQGGSL